MKKLILLIIMAILCAITTPTNAGVYTFQPDPVDLYDLDHYKYYIWKIDFNPPNTIVEASLFFDNIANWDNNTNIMYLSLLSGDDLTVDLLVGNDNQGGGDNTLGFNGAVSLMTYSLNTTPGDITYDFDSSEIATLNTYAADGVFGIGFDPDGNQHVKQPRVGTQISHTQAT